LVIFLIIILPFNKVGATSVSPTSLSASLRPGESDSPQPINTNVTASSVPLDVLFILDLSSSLIQELDECKSEATNMMNQISSSYADSKFGVASFMDYPGTFTYPGYSEEYGDAGDGDYAWNLDQDLTTNTGVVATTINNLVMGFGGDVPQDYSRVLYESQFVGWRANAIKVVVLMGDAPTHDEDFYAPFTFGGDPGRDAIAQTADDLDFQTIVGELASADIHIVTINSYTGAPDPFATFSFTYMAEQTGGLYRELGDVSDIPETIVNAVKSTAKFTSITLRAATGYEDWMSFSPSSYSDVGDGETKTFQITLNAPAGTNPGTYQFDIFVIGTGSGETTIGTIPATINVSTMLPAAGANSNRHILILGMLALFSAMIYRLQKGKFSL